jgi:hypothetical protein
MANHLSQLSVISIRQPNAPAKLAQWAENGRWDQAAGELGWDWGLEVAISELWKYPKVTENHVSRNVIKIRCRMANRTIARPVHMHKIMCRFSQWIRPANLCKCRKMSQTCLFFLRLNLRSNPLDSREDWIWGFAFGDSLEALRNGKSGGRGWQAAWSSSPQVSHSLTTVHIWTPFCRWLIDSKSLLWCLQMISKLLGYLD